MPLKQQTKKWSDREVLIVDGIKCCYTVVERQGYLVHLPGGEKKFAHDMIFEGFEVILPDLVRD